eukprot:s736_g13.t1
MQPHVVGAHPHVSTFEDLLCTSRPGQKPPAGGTAERALARLSAHPAGSGHLESTWGSPSQKKTGKSTVSILGFNEGSSSFLEGLQSTSAAVCCWRMARTSKQLILDLRLRRRADFSPGTVPWEVRQEPEPHRNGSQQIRPNSCGFR